MTTAQGKQIVAGVIGITALGVAARYTFGGVLGAPIGMTVAWWFVRRRGRRLSRSASWVAAIAATGVVLIALIGFAAMQMPAGSWSKIQKAADSTKVHRPPPPAWLERIAPGSTARANAQEVSFGAGATVGFAIVGAMFGVGMLSGFLGTLGWLATMPLAYAITGRWVGSRPRDPPFVEDAVTA
jgi:hypothetical protein